MLLGIKTLHPDGHGLHKNDVAYADKDYAGKAGPVCRKIQGVFRVERALHIADDEVHEQAAENAQYRRKRGDGRNLFVVYDLYKRNGYSDGDEQRNAEDEAGIVKAEGVVHPVHDVDEIAVVADEEYAQGEEHERKLAVCDKALEIKRRAELVPEAPVFYGLERGRVLEQEKRRDADENGNAAGYGEEDDVAGLWIRLGRKTRYEHSADESAHECADNGQRRGDRADLAGV